MSVQHYTHTHTVRSQSQSLAFCCFFFFSFLCTIRQQNLAHCRLNTEIEKEIPFCIPLVFPLLLFQTFMAVFFSPTAHTNSSPSSLFLSFLTTSSHPFLPSKQLVTLPFKQSQVALPLPSSVPRPSASYSSIAHAWPTVSVTCTEKAWNYIAWNLGAILRSFVLTRNKTCRHFFCRLTKNNWKQKRLTLWSKRFQSIFDLENKVYALARLHHGVVSWPRKKSHFCEDKTADSGLTEPLICYQRPKMVWSMVRDQTHTHTQLFWWFNDKDKNGRLAE